MLLPEVNHWFIQIKKTEAAGESINVNDGGQYSGKSRKSNKQSRTTNKSGNEGNDDALTLNNYQKEKKLNFTLTSAMKGKPHNQQLKKVCKLDTCKALQDLF